MKRLIAVAAVVAVLGAGSLARAGESEKSSTVEKVKAKVKAVIEKVKRDRAGSGRRTNAHIGVRG